MNRRQFTHLTGVATAASMLQQRGLALQSPQANAPTASEAEVERSMEATMPATGRRQIAMLLYPGMYPLDLIGPHAFLSGLPNVDVHLVWKTLESIVTAQKIKLTPTTTLADCPKQLDVLFVPGGSPGTILMMQDAEVLSFLADRGSHARYVTSVCTGSLILGAAGLLKGYRATSHWNTRDILPLLGAIPIAQRVVEDRNRITGGGVTSGIDFGLLLAARMSDPVYAQMLQLVNEYDPQPPFRSGTPTQAGPAMTAHLEAMLAPSHEKSRAAAVAANTRLGLS